MAFPTKKLGKSTLDLTPIGLGAWAIGGDWRFGWGHQDDADSVATIRRAVEHRPELDRYGRRCTASGIPRKWSGGRWRDVPRESRPYVLTKSSLVWDDAAQRLPQLARSHRFARKSSRACGGCRPNASISIRFTGRRGRRVRKGTSPGNIEEAWSTMVALRDEGKVAFVGVSNFDIAQLQRISRIETPASLQPPSWMLRPGDRGGYPALLRRAQHRGDSVFTDAVGVAHRNDDA